MLQVLSGWEPALIRSYKFRHRPVEVDDGFLFQLAPSMRRNSGKEQREQSLESPTCLPPLLPLLQTLHPPTPSGNQNRETFLQRVFFSSSFLHVLDSTATGGSQPDVARSAKHVLSFLSSLGQFQGAAVDVADIMRWRFVLFLFFSQELERTNTKVLSPFLYVE